MAKKPQRGRNARPFEAIAAAHALVKAAEDLNWDISDLDQFVNRVQNVEFGLSAEIEFATLLRWLGNCAFVHRLNEDSFSNDWGKRFEVPDLIALFKIGEQVLGVLIEVKTTADLRLELTPEYLQKLTLYSEAHGKPLLVAWKPRGFRSWLLFDPLEATNCTTTSSGKFRYELGDVIKNDLMTVIAGDARIVPVEGVGLTIEAVLESKEDVTEVGYTGRFQTSAAYYIDGHGQRSSYLPAPVHWALLSESEEAQTVTDTGVSLTVRTNGAGTSAQAALRTALAFQLEDSEKVHWKDVGKNLDDVFESGELFKECSAYLGIYFKYILLQQPVTLPGWVNPSWMQAAFDRLHGFR